MTAFFAGMLVWMPLGAALLWVTQAALADDLDETSEQDVETVT